MFNVGGPEILVILLVALVILGPDQLPKAMRTFGNVMGEIRKVSGGFQAEMRKAMDTIDVTPSSGATTRSTSGASTTTTSTDADDKPQSPKPPQGEPTPGLARTPAEADVTEVVARNVAPAAEAPSAQPEISPEDRAAG